jgi:RecJ-like exonuclease
MQPNPRYIIRKRAVICPVCQGSGEYKWKKCHGCDGKGWIVIDESYWEYSDPYNPNPYPYPNRPSYS